MTFESRNLSVLAYASGFTLWHYRTTDRPAELQQPHYFDAASEMLRANDLIICNHGGGDGHAGGTSLMVVAANEAGVVHMATLAFASIQKGNG